MILLIIPRQKRELAAVIAAMTAVYFFCVFYHLPSSVVTPSHYSDINFIFQDRGVGPNRVPYVDYNLEYPPIIGLIVWAAGSFGSEVSYHYATAALLYPFALMTVISLYLTCKAKKIDINRIFIWCILALSMIWFVYYSWDIVAVGFMCAAIYFRVTNRTKMSSLFLGLGAAAKLIPLFLLPVFMQQEKKWIKRFQVAGIVLGFFLIFNLPFMILNFDGWLWIYSHTALWGLENVYWLYLFGPAETFLPKVGFGLLLLFFTIVIWRRKMGFLQKCWAMMAAFLASTYMFPPQFSLFLLPLLVLVPAMSLPFFYTFELANVSIIIFWFNQYGVYPGGPLDPASPVQWISTFRQLLLLLLLAKFLSPGLSMRKAGFVQFWRRAYGKLRKMK